MDIQYLLFLQGLRETAPVWLNKLLFFLSELAVNGLMSIYMMLIYWCINKRAGFYLFFCTTGATSVNQLVKNTACVYRPWIRDARVQVAAEAAETATGYSFPSGHTTNAMACYGGTAMWQRKHKAVVIPLIIAAMLTGFARNWLCAHTPQDVCVALILTTLFLFAAAKGMAWIEAHPDKETTVLVVGLLIVAVLLLYIQLKPYPMNYLEDGSLLVDPYQMKTDCYKAYGAMTGMLIAWYVERKWVKFDVAGSKIVRLIRFGVGAGICLGIKSLGLDPIKSVLGTHWGMFVFYMIQIVFIIALYPAIFTSVEKRLKK